MDVFGRNMILLLCLFPKLQKQINGKGKSESQKIKLLFIIFHMFCVKFKILSIIFVMFFVLLLICICVIYKSIIMSIKLHK